MTSDTDILKKFIDLIENAKLKVRGGRGYSAGHPYQEKDFNPVYGKSDHEPDEEEAPEDESPVKVSRAFDKEADDE